MRVEKWGDGLAVRLPAAVVDGLGLREGDEIELRIAGNREIDVARDSTKENALARLRRFRRPRPIIQRVASDARANLPRPRV